MVAAVLVVAAAALDLIAATLGYNPPWLLGVNLTFALFVLGAGILGAAQIATRAEAETSRMRGALEDSQARLAAIVDSAMDAIITVDEQQRVVLFNRAAEQVVRCRREQALGSSLDRFLPSRFRAAHRGHIEQFGSTGGTSRRMGDVTTCVPFAATTAGNFRSKPPSPRPPRAIATTTP
jgi:PAS domain-containing protein